MIMYDYVLKANNEDEVIDITEEFDSSNTFEVKIITEEDDETVKYMKGKFVWVATRSEISPDYEIIMFGFRPTGEAYITTDLIDITPVVAGSNYNFRV